MPTRRATPAQIGLVVGVLLMLAAGLIVVGVSIEGKPTGTGTPDTAFSLLLESPLSLAGMVVASLLMTLIVTRWPRPVIGVLVILFSVGLAVVDGIEWSTKASMGAVGFAALAAVILGIRLVTVVLAALLVRRAPANA